MKNQRGKMVIYLPGAMNEVEILDNLSPREIVTHLDKHVIGQKSAKRAVNLLFAAHPPYSSKSVNRNSLTHI